MVAKKKTDGPKEITIAEVETGILTVCICGTSPILLNRVSEKAKRELLFPATKTRADKAAKLKHDPIKEFQAAPYRDSDDDAATLLRVPGLSVKAAMRSAALDLPDSNKSEIGRLTYVPIEYVGLYGIPYLHMTVTRCADAKHTPDIRTRAIVKQWALAPVDVHFVRPLLREQSIANLIACAGMTQGIGDFRQQKGAGSFGAFRVCNPDDPEYLSIIKAGGRAAQVEAMDAAEPYDDESAEMLGWFEAEVERRGFKHTKRGQGNGATLGRYE